MKKTFKHVLSALRAVLVVGGLNNELNAQSPQGPGSQIPSGIGEARGLVVETDSKQPLANTAVAIRSQKDSSLVSGAMTGADGSFKVSGLRPGAYYIRVTRIGFGPKFQSFLISPTAPVASIGAIAMNRVAVTLSGVDVVAERATMTVEPDRNSYTAKSVAPAATNASEVLDAVPSVQVDPDGKVSLRGNENVAVQINGRASPMKGEALGAFLKQLPAGVIEKIEVIPNPSAKQDPEGMAGIINIVLKENVDLGVSGGISGSAASTRRYNLNSNLGYQAGALTTFSSYGYNADERDVLGLNDRERFNALGQSLSFTHQDINGLANRAGHNLTATADYKLNKRDVITNAVIANWRRAGENTTNGYTEFNGSRVLLDQYDRLRNNANKATLFDYALSWKRTLEPRKHEVNSELRFNRNSELENSLLWKDPGVGTRIEQELTQTDALTRQLTATVDYTKTLNPKRKLETGFKSNSRWLDREYDNQKDLLGTGIYTPSNLSNSFDFNESVHAVYGVLSQNVGKIDWQTGLRAEYANRDFKLARSNENFPHSYTSLFPSGVISYKHSDMTALKASYSRRIRRPGSQELNPFPTFFDAQNVFIGNPKLNPEYTDAFELGLTRSGSFYTLQVAPFWRHTTDVIRVNINTEDFVDGREVTSVSFQNLATSNSWGMDINTQLRAGPKFNGLVGLNIYKIVTDGGSQSTLASDALAWSVRFNGNAQLTQTLTLSGMYRYQAPTKIERGEFGSFKMANFSLRQKLWGEKASVNLRVVDPFNTMGMKIRTGNDLLIQRTERRFGSRGTFLGFQYNFGQAPKIKAPQQQEQPDSPGFPSGG